MMIVVEEVSMVLDKTFPPEIRNNWLTIQKYYSKSPHIRTYFLRYRLKKVHILKDSKTNFKV